MVDVRVVVEGRALEADAVDGFPRHESGDSSPAGAGVCSEALREGRRVADGVVRAKAKMMDPLAVSAKMGGDRGVVSDRLDELEIGISHREVRQAHPG